VVIDPAWDGEEIAAAAVRLGWRVIAVWLTHAHFDHFAGSAALFDKLPQPVPVALHPDDQPLWRGDGLAGMFGLQGVDPGPEPTIPLAHGHRLWLGRHEVEVRHVPGHTPGHVVFVSHTARLAFCGDVIFQGSIGRTDLPGGDEVVLMESIRHEILSLPDDYHLYPGHGPATTVGEERVGNPFL
jgi:glyoxylase-like metal-dependent hydrolase (beta-lactamase superfamily II)